MGTISVTLTSANLGNATESDFDAWASYVAAHLDEETGLDITVDQARFGECGDDAISGATDEQADAIRTAIGVTLWERWCAEGAPRS